MQTNKKTPIRMRLLSWIMAMVMMCTSISVPAFAEEIAFDDETAIELQSADEIGVEEIDDFSDDTWSDEVWSEEEILSGEEVFDDILNDEEVYSDGEMILEDIEPVMLTVDEEKLDDEENFSQVEDLNTDEAAAIADTGTIELKVFDVRFVDADGYYVNPNSSSASHTDNDYWAYLAPGMTCPTTVPEPTIATSAWTNCNDYTYQWDSSYIKITMSNTYTISNMRWEKNVLKFTVNDGDTNSGDFTLTVNSTDFDGNSAKALIEKIKVLDFGISMADSFDTVKSKIENVSGLPDGIKLGLTTVQKSYKHNAEVGTADVTSGKDGTASLKISMYFTDAKNSYPIYFTKNNNFAYTMSIAVKALAYSEESKVNVTAVANGNGTAEAKFVGMVAQQQTDKSYKWLTRYTIDATPAENHRLVIWLYKQEDTSYSAGQNLSITVDTDAEREYIACFGENTAPTVTKSAKDTLSSTARKTISQSISSWFEDYTKNTVNENEYKIKDTLTYSATLNGKPLSTTEFTSSGQLKWVTGTVGSYKLVITATDNLGASIEHEVTLNITASQESQYKVGVSATYMGEPYSLGTDGMNAKITYAAGYNGDFSLDNLDNEYFKSDNQYVFTIEDWDTLRDEWQFSKMKIGDLTIAASDIPTNGSKIFKLDNMNAIRLYYYASTQTLLITLNYNRLLTSISEDLMLQLAFCDVEAVLKVNAGENGAVSRVAYKSTEDGKCSYDVYASPDVNYQLVSYTINGETEPVPLNLTTDNYEQSGRINVFPIEIEKDTEITLNFAPATMELELWSYVPDTSSKAQTASYWYMGVFNQQFNTQHECKLTKQFEENKTSVPLVEGMGYQFWIKANINGYMDVAPAEDSSEYVSVLKMYSGDTVEEENLFFDSTDPDTVCDSGTPFNTGTTYTLNGRQSGGLYATVMSCPDMDKITVVLKFGGYVLQKTFDVETASDVVEAKEFAKYYTDTYGLDKFGQELYTAEEKATEGYAKYCKYSNFRYVLRLTYNEYYAKIAQASEDKRATMLAEGKQALDDASVGKGCNAVVWSFKEQGGVKSIPVMVAVPNDVEDYSKHPSAGTNAHNAMCAALEALYPGSWGYTYTATQFGAFVNSVTTGGEDDTGKVHVRISSTGSPGANYGFWFYNGKFSEWGVSNYNPYDGDVMWWGGGDVEKNWAWALLRLKYGDQGIADTLAAKGETRTVAKLSADELKAFFPEVDFSRYGQFRTVSAAELVMNKIGQIGTVTPSSGPAIQAARAAYDNLSESDKALVKNYETLLAAEETFAQMAGKAEVSYSDALTTMLTNLQSGSALGVGSTNGEWAILSLARSSMISGNDSSGQAVNYLNAVQKALKNGELTKSTDYARVTLALSALGVSAPEELITQCEDYDKAVAQGINAVAYALLALNSKPYDTENTAIRERYISYLVNNTCKDGGWVLGDTSAAADTDVTAMVIQALAPYYKEENRTNVKTAVDNALTALKAMQTDNGGFASYETYNVESIAQVIVALTSIGQDPTTWNDKDAVDALLHFYTTKDGKKGFSHILSGDIDQMATEQATYALAAYYRFKTNQNTLYDMTDAFEENNSSTNPTQTIESAAKAVAEMDSLTVSMENVNTEEAVLNYVKTTVETKMKLLGISGPTYETAIKTADSGEKQFVPAVAGTVEQTDGTKGSFVVEVTISMKGAVSVTKEVKGEILPTKYVPKKEITVKFSLYGDTLHEVTKDGDLHTYQFNADTMDLWIPETTVTIAGDATVGDVFKKVLDENGFTYVGLNSNYISKITNTKKGITLSEFDNTNKSGWMYLVNGTHPDVGLNAKKLEDGDVIIWHWTDEYQLESGSEMYDNSRMISYVENLIKAVAEPEATQECKNAIEQARAAYNKLSAEQQNKISNYETLTKTEATVSSSAWCWHEYDAGKVTTEATCVKNGVKTYTCKHCKNTKTETIKAVGHTAGTWTETKAATCKETGTKVQKCSVCGEVLKTESIPVTNNHKYASWTKTSDATVFAAETQKHTCSVCGASETKNVGSKLKAVLEVPGKLTSISIKKGNTKSLNVTMANGDSVASVKSSAPKTLKVTLDKNGKITLKALKKGSAKLTVKLASGKSRTYKVSVVTGTIKTTKVTVTSVTNNKLTLKKGKTHTLKSELKPFTSTQKVTYKTSNKKVATITSSGKIKAVSAGKATITVTSGSKKVKVTVTVPGITGLKSSVTVKKNKTTTLKPKAYGISEKVTYTSSNPKVATVTAAGKVKGIKKGTAKITVQAGSYKKTVTVKVK